MLPELQSPVAPRLTDSERAILAAMVERRSSTASALAHAADVSMTTTRRVLRSLEDLGAASREGFPSSEQQRSPDLWSATVDGVQWVMGADATSVWSGDALSTCESLGMGRSARDRVLDFVAHRPGQTVGEIARANLLSRRRTVEILGALLDSGVVMRISRRNASGARNADGWSLDPGASAHASKDEPRG